MRVSSLGVARPVYYDRNAQSFIGGYEAPGVAPHANTGRFSLTVAAGKKLYIESVYAGVERTTAATAVGIAYSIQQLFSTASAAQSTINQGYLYNAAVGTENRSALPIQGMVSAGDQLLVFTYDGSTGGQCTYRAIYKYTIFDA